MRPASNISNPRIAALGLSALAVSAVFALLFLFSGGDATASNAPPTDDHNPATQRVSNAPNASPSPSPSPTPHPTPEGCPTAANTASVVSAGEYGIFDVYWSTAEENLATNPCPPAVEHQTTDEVDPLTGLTKKVWTGNTRTASHINLDTTIIHVLEGNKQTRPSDDTTWKAKYPFLYVDTDGDDAVDTAIPGTENFWVLPYCDPTYSGHTEDPDNLCIGFSAGLLHKDHWLLEPGSDTKGPIQYEFESIREPGIAEGDRGLAFAFYPHDATPAGKKQAPWTPTKAHYRLLPAPTSTGTGALPCPAPTCSRFTPRATPKPPCTPAPLFPIR